MSKVKCKGCGNDVKIKIIPSNHRWGSNRVIQCKNCNQVVDLTCGVLGIFNVIFIFLAAIIAATCMILVTRFLESHQLWIAWIIMVIIITLAQHYLFCFLYNKIKTLPIHYAECGEETKDPNFWTPPEIDLLTRRKEFSDD